MKRKIPEKGIKYMSYIEVLMRLTRKENEILDWIKKKKLDKITIVAIEKNFGISYKVAREHLISLENKGKLTSHWESKGHKKYWKIDDKEDWH